MQLVKAPEEPAFLAVEAAVHPQRLTRYMPAAGREPQAAFRFYLWNCLLCECFHFPLHFAEIVSRNALGNALARRSGEQWYLDATFRKVLDERFLAELDIALAKERRQQGLSMSHHHMVSALTFGFWEHLTTKRFERILWARGIQNVFASAPRSTTLQDVHDLMESVRRWRNRIAHHQAIFDKGPMRKHQDAMKLIGLACSDTAAWVAAHSKVPAAIALRPK